MLNLRLFTDKKILVLVCVTQTIYQQTNFSENGFPVQYKNKLTKFYFSMCWYMVCFFMQWSSSQCTLMTVLLKPDAKPYEAKSRHYSPFQIYEAQLQLQNGHIKIQQVAGHVLLPWTQTSSAYPMLVNQLTIKPYYMQVMSNLNIKSPDICNKA